MANAPRLSPLERFERWLLPVGALAALVIGVVGIGRFIRLDEANSIIIASSSVGQLLEYLRNDNNLPFYYLLLHGWIRLAGISEWAVHFPSVMFYLLAVGVTYRLGWEVSRDRRSALYSGFFYFVSSQAIHQAQKARMYSLLGLLAALATLFLVRVWWRETAGKRDWVLYVVVNWVGTFVHVWYFFLLFAHALCGLLFQPKKLRSLAAALGASVVPFLLLWARYLPQQARIGAVDWMPHVRPSFFVGVLGEFYGGERWGLIFLLVVAGICVWGAKNQSRRKQLPYRSVAALTTIALASMMVPLLVSFVRPIYWPGRYTMIALPAFAAALGCTVATLASPALRVAFAYCVLIVVVVLHIRTRNEVFENSSNVFTEGSSDRAATLQLCRGADSEDTLVFTGLTRAGVEYYVRRFGCERSLALLSVPSDTAEHLGWVRQAGPEELRVEAEKIVTRFSQEGTGDHKLWLIPAHGRGLDQKVLTEVFDRDLGTSIRLPLRGSFFDEALIYTHKNAAQKGTRPE
jgi:hypothetical protein